MLNRALSWNHRRDTGRSPRFAKPTLLHPYVVEGLIELEELLANGAALGGHEKAQSHVEFWTRLLALPFGSTTKASILGAHREAGAKRQSVSTFLDEASVTADVYRVRELIELNRRSLDGNVREILAYPTVTDLLIAQARYVKRFTTPEAIFNYLASATGATKDVHAHLVWTALEKTDAERALQFPAGSKKAIVKLLTQPAVSLLKDVFGPRLDASITSFVYDAKWRAKIANVAAFSGIDEQDKLALIAAFKRLASSPDGVSEAYLVSVGQGVLEARAKGIGTAEEPSGDPYFVDYYDTDSTALLEVDPSCVRAAAQLFFAMVWGDEMGVFRAINEIAAPSMKHLNISIRDEKVAEALRLYVLDEAFFDERSGRERRRVSPAEREMYYRQVFGVGDSPLTDGMNANPEFFRYWGVLVTEVAAFISKLEDISEAGNVSRQRIHQAVVDIQLNLTSSCVGMAKAAAPVVHGELDFVIRNLLNTDEFSSQLARKGRRSFLSVVETVLGARDLNPLRVKGIQGHKILTAIANWNESTPYDDDAFNDFLTTVEAFIVAESQLAPAGLEDPRAAGSNTGLLPQLPGMPNIPGMPAVPTAPSYAPNGAQPTNGASTQSWQY